MTWRDLAGCRDTEPELFFSDSEGRNAISSLRTVAEQTCGACPALEACAQYADDRREHGLWAASYRSSRTGRYKRTPLIPGAPINALRPRVVEASIGMWVA